VTRHEYTAIAGVIRDLPCCDRLAVADRFAAMFAKRDPRFDRTWFLAAALWGIERRADEAVGVDGRRGTRRAAPTPPIGLPIKLGH